jgi:5'(3')-deoxyribonucleotidase
MHLQEKKMLIREIISEKPESKPIVYLDMDGVLADFFSEWAKLAGIKTGNYKDIPSANIDPTLDKMIGTDFFAQLPKFPTADKLIQMVINRFGSYKILSSPLRNDHENSKKHKIDWIGRKLKIKPSETIISSNKGSYATQPDGTPNILIDDLGRNIQNWMSNGGLGIKYQADEDPLSKVQQRLEQFKKGEVTQEIATERQEHIFKEDESK